MQWLADFPPQTSAFLATVLIGFVIGLEVHSYRRAHQLDLGFGTTRTITLLSMLGFVLTLLDPGLRLFAVGYVTLTALLTIHYHFLLHKEQQSLLPALIALLTYPVGALALTQSTWLLMLYTVTLLLVLGEKPGIRRLSDQLRETEAITFAKFLIMVGIVLPMLPNQAITPNLAITWRQLWISIVAVSGISWSGYLVQTYFLPRSGMVVTGILGGIYSSTATTVVLSRRAAEDSDAGTKPYSSALVFASGMMYARLLLLIAMLGHISIARTLLAPFSAALVTAMLAGWWLNRRQANHESVAPAEQSTTRHPLEFSTAMLFAGLFVAFALLTRYIIATWGTSGLHWLSFLSGFSDIDPFILSLLAGHFAIDSQAISDAIIIASASNNLLKGLYAILIPRNTLLMPAVIALLGMSAVSLIWVFI